MFQGCLKSVPRVSQGFSKGVPSFQGCSKVFKKCPKGVFKDVLRVFQGCFKSVSRVLQGCFMVVSRVFQRYFNVAFSVFQVFYGEKLHTVCR